MVRIRFFMELQVQLDRPGMCMIRRKRMNYSVENMLVVSSDMEMFPCLPTVQQRAVDMCLDQNMSVVLPVVLVVLTRQSGHMEEFLSRQMETM